MSCVYPEAESLSSFELQTIREKVTGSPYEEMVGKFSLDWKSPSKTII